MPALAIQDGPASACKLSGFSTPLVSRIVTAPQRTALSGPTLIRLLARLSETNAAEPARTLSQRLTGWLDWTDAIALSSALGGSVSAVAAADARTSGTAGTCESECQRVRAALAQAIAADSVLAPAKPSRAARFARSSVPAHAPQRNEAVEDATDYTLFRQCYLSLQQSMETSIGNLRRRLRAALAAHSPAMSRLAMLDAAMERALGAREQNLLSSAPVVLRGHFERLRSAEAERLAHAEPQSPAAEPGAWLSVFRKDMQCVLLAELELRFQPVQGLLAALRAR